MGFGVGNERGGLAFAPGAGGSRDSDEREHRPSRLGHSPVIADLAAVGQDEIAAFGGVHGTATSQANEEVNSTGAGHFDAQLDVECGRVLVDAIKDTGFQVGSFDKGADPSRVASFDEARIRDNKNTRGTQFRGQSSNLRDAVDTKNQAGA